MAFFKYLFCSVLATVSLVGEGDGWFPVEKTRKGTEVLEVDPSIWVLFSKDLEGETMRVRFPKDPVYRYGEDGSLEMVAEGEDETFYLSVQEAGSMAPPVGDLHYQSEGKWVHEHFVQTDRHFYHFKTVSAQSDVQGHEAFVSSFLIEKKG